jgi:hypothetical protein
MKETLLLENMAQLEKEDAHAVWADPRWEKLSLGSLTAQEKEQLRVWAQTNPLAQAAWDAYAPMPVSQAEALAERVVAACIEKEKTPWWQGLKQRMWVWTAVPVMAGVAAAVVFSLDTSHSGVLPGYSLAVSGVVQTQRSGHDISQGKEPVHVSVQGQVHVVLRPEKPVQTPLAVKVWVQTPSGGMQFVQAETHVSTEGAVRVAFSPHLLGELQLPASSVLWIALAPSSVKTPQEGIWDEASWRGEGWVLFQKGLVFVP